MVIANDETYFYGDLIQGDELNRIERDKINQYDEVLVPRSDLADRQKDGWEFRKEVRGKLLLKKKKDDGELLENDVWLLFKHMGFKEMNKDRNFKIKAGVITQQIDVFAKDDNNIFVVECKTGTPSLKKDILGILQLKNNIKNSIEKKYGNGYRISFLLVTRNIDWTSSDENLAIENFKNSFFTWKEEDLEAYKILVDQIGSASKYQMYSLLFGEKESSEVGEIEVPAMYGGVGKEKYYSFLIQPEKLFKIIYVHRREKSKPQEIGDAYQRMVNKKRIEDIGDYINHGHSFPNNIILAFKPKLKPRFEPFKKEKKAGNIVYGILKFPCHYGCAWVIDGQHRLYGYSKSNHASDHTIPVIAFESLNIKDQANLFIDINKEQKAVSSSLLWELYPDIYEGSDEPQQQLLRAVSLVAKKLNYDDASVLKDNIQLPSIVVEENHANLSLENICRAILENKIIDERGGLFYENNYEETIEHASRIIETYFKEVSELFKDDWESTKKSNVNSNIGIRIFFVLFRQIIKYLNFIEEERLYQKQDLNDFKEKIKELVEPIVEKLNGMSIEERENFFGGTGKKFVMNTSKQMAWWIKEKTHEAFAFEILRRWAPPVSKEITDNMIRQLLEETEKSLREFIIQTLIGKYGDVWWKEGIDAGVKDRIKERIERQIINKESWNKELLSLPAERKFKEHGDTPSLRETILFSKNWSLFESTFVPEKEIVYTRFKDFEFVRDKYQHFAEQALTKISKNLGFWAMIWIRKCVGLQTPKEILPISE